MLNLIEDMPTMKNEKKLHCSVVLKVDGPSFSLFFAMYALLKDKFSCRIEQS